MIDWYPPQASLADGLGSDPTQVETDRRAERFIKAVAKRHPDIAEHARRTSAVAVAIAGELGWGADERLLLHQATLLHDVGMLHVADRIRTKNGALSAPEQDQIKEHSAMSAAMVSDVLTEEQITWIRSHHERPDGAGYPRNLKRPQIPEASLIIALADAWVAMVSGRSYRPRMSGDRALAECWRNAGLQFSTEAVEALVALWQRTGDEKLVEARESAFGSAPLTEAIRLSA